MRENLPPLPHDKAGLQLFGACISVNPACICETWPDHLGTTSALRDPEATASPSSTIQTRELGS